jgi:hypothetical protein
VYLDADPLQQQVGIPLDQLEGLAIKDLDR